MSEKEKSPFGKYSVKEIEAVERGSYVIQVGDDLFSYNGKMGFSLQRAESFYADIMNGLQEMKKSENQLERDDAMKCLLLLKIFPFRIH